MENSQFKEQYIDINKISADPMGTIEKSKRAVMLLMEAADILEDAGIAAISRDSLFLAKSVALFVNDLEKDTKDETKVSDIQITEKDYEATLALIKAMDIDDE